MPPNSEIEKLERRWKDNPKGTGFAPYAEALRKQGELVLSRDVLRQGLEMHPDHIPGNIVLGRCCLDLEEDGPAEAAFKHVLDLDVENVIALKALADITERQGRLGETVGWLGRLVASDPNNDEAAAHLARVETAREAAGAAASGVLSEAGAHAAPPMPVEASGAGVGATPPSPLAAFIDAVTEQIPELAPPVPAAPPHTVAAAPAPPPPVIEAPAAEAAPESPAPSAPEPLPLTGFESAELDVGTLRTARPSEAIEGIMQDEGFEGGLAVPSALEGLAPPSAFVLGVEKTDTIELTPAGGSEFQASDDSASLLGFSSEASEFQSPDGSADLSLSATGGAEYQTASSSESLLRSLSVPETAEPEEAPALELLSSTPDPEPTLEFAPSQPLPPAESAPEVEPVLAPLPELAVPAPILESPDATLLIAPLEEEEVPSAAVPRPTPTPAPEPEKSVDLKLIFPEDAARPQRVSLKRISQEVPAIKLPAHEPEATEPAVGEPEPVMTESMAELYARQGHTAEALRVYRVLASRQPGEPRFQARIRDLEAAQAPRPRRPAYAAAETGGESVESFFRALAGARPGLMGLAAAAKAEERVRGATPGAPTRPASGPVSLSAIFGEEPASAAPAPAPPAPAAPTADAFSFDQFFGGAAAQQGSPPKPAGPSDADLDQFQSWLKSLKK